jgi:hypothetical protein
VTDQQQEAGQGGRPAEHPGRYQRSIAGGIGSMIVLVLVVLAFVLIRDVFRDNEAVDVEPVDYLAVVGPAQEAGLQVVYPPSLPDGWTATSVAYDPGDPPAWGVGMHTDDGKFVGVRQEDADLDSLLDTHVDEDPVEGETMTVDGALVPEWQEWSDADGDHAYAASVGDHVVLVYGSAPTDDLLTIVRSLTDAPLGD